MDINDTYAFSRTAQQFASNGDLLGLKIVPGRDYDAKNARYDMITFSRRLAPFSSDGAPATRKRKTGRTLRTAEFGHIKISNPLTASDLLARVSGTVNKVDPNAHILREAANLNNILDRTKEFAVWKMFSGALASTDLPDSDIVFSIDYAIPASHKPTAAASWATAGTNIVGDVKTWKKLAQKDGGLAIKKAYVNSNTMGYLLTNDTVKELLGQAGYREQVGKDGKINHFLGIDWIEYDDVYEDVNGVIQSFIPDDVVIMLPVVTDEVAEIQGGNMMVPMNKQLVKVIGKYGYTYISEDPPGQIVVVGHKVLPVLKQPLAVIYADVTP